MAARKTKAGKDKLEMDQSPEDIAKQNAESRRLKTVTVPVDDEVHEALEKVRSEIENQFPGMRVTQSGLARIAILRS